jgi:uncharacterized protein (TIGR02246 family)
MKQHRSAKLGYALGVLIAAIGFTTSATAQVVDQTTRQQIENLNAAFVGDWNRQDATGVANIFTPDGVWVVPAPAGRQLYVGTQAIQQHAEDNFKSGETYIQSAVEQVWPFEIGGGTPIDKVVVFGAYHLLGQGQSGPIKIDGHWTAMDVRGVDGAWKYRLVTAIHDPPPATAAQMAVSQELSAINQRRNAAFEKGDADAFAADFADNAVYTSSLEPYRIEGKAAIKDFFATLFETFATRHIAPRGGSTRVYANDTVVANDGSAVINYTDKNGNHSAIFTRSTTIWVKMGNEWKMVDQHISQFK